MIDPFSNYYALNVSVCVRPLSRIGQLEIHYALKNGLLVVKRRFLKLASHLYLKIKTNSLQHAPNLFGRV